MLGTIGMTLLGMVLWQATEVPEFRGKWMTDKEAQWESGTPLLAGLLWTRIQETVGNEVEPPLHFKMNFTRSQVDSSQVWNEVSVKLNALFRKYYPKATIVNQGVSGIKVEHKVTTFEFPSTDGKAGKREAERQQGPKKGGVLCRVYLYPGPYNGQRSLSPAQEGQVAQDLIDRKEYKQLLMAPYSQKSDVHMWVALSYPPDVDEAFLEKFREIMADFEKAE